MTNTLTISRELALFESIIGKKPDAFLHEPVYQVTESEVLEFARQLAAPVVERQEPSAWIVTDMNGDSYFAYDKQTPRDKPLYTSPPAPEIRPLRVTPPAGEVPPGTHHNNDGLDGYR